MPNISMLTLMISLDETKPAVWRTIIVREDVTLMQLHDRIRFMLDLFEQGYPWEG